MQMPTTQTTPQLQPEKTKSRRGCVTCLVITLVILLILMFFCSCCSFFALSLAGAKGQPGTIIKPSKAEAGKQAGTSMAIPTGLAAVADKAKIDLKWNAVNGAKNVRVYRSEKAGQSFTQLTEVAVSANAYADDTVKKGVTYYYVVTALSSSGAESGNSAQVAAVIDVPPVVPKGIYSWTDVKAKAVLDEEYLRILTKVTGLTMTDVDRLASKEKTGQLIKATLYKGTVITNTMEDYRIVPNFVLTYDRQVLCDDGEVPRVLTKCGNPMKLQAPVTQTAILIQQVQVVVTNIILVMPANVTNVFINAGQAANSIAVTALPGSVLIDFGPDFAPRPNSVYVDPTHFGNDLYKPDEDIKLEQGQQWIEKGKLLVTANPADPAPQEDVTMTVKVLPAKAGIEVSYNVQGTDGYTTSGTISTNGDGEIQFRIPGGAANVADTINVSVPAKNVSGSVQYTF